MPMPTMATSRNDPDDGIIISSVLQSYDLLTKEIFLFLDGSELGLSAALVCSLWGEASRDDGLWHIIAVTRWPSMVTTLIEAGVLDPGMGINDGDGDGGGGSFRSFCRSRLSPTPKPTPSWCVCPDGLTEPVGEDDELWILLDMPNLIEEEEGDDDDDGPVSLQRAFRLEDTFRRHVTDWEGCPPSAMGFYPEAPCDCPEGGGDAGEEHYHPSAWMRLRLYDDFRSHPRRRAKEEDLFELKISVLRRSDGKVATLVDPSSAPRYKCILPQRLRAVWAKHTQTYRNSHIEDIILSCSDDPEKVDRGFELRVKAGLNGNWIRREEEMTLNHIEFGLQLFDGAVDDDERDDVESPNMIVPDTLEDLNWFFQRTGLAWI